MAGLTPLWPFCPMPGHTKDSKLAVDINAFGDGYVHRSTRGLNPVRPAYGVTFTFNGDDEMAQMDSFLAANACAGFYYQPPGEPAPVFVTADEWTYSIQVKGLDGVVGTLSATFARVFNPQPISGPPPVDPSVADSVGKAMAFLKSQMAARTSYTASTLSPNDLSIDRHSSGPWTGIFSVPVDPNASLPYTPILIEGPIWFPLVAGQRADFNGRVDFPFFSMDGFAGRHDMINPTPPPATITDPSSVYANLGVNWGRYFVIGSVGAATQFIAPIAANATWSASVSSVPHGSWSFQLATYATKADADADANRILVGNPWKQSERPGDVRGYYAASYAPGVRQFTGVALASTAAPQSTITGMVTPFTGNAGFTYQILATAESDVEYCWALQPTGPGGGAFTITRPFNFGGKVKLRLVEQLNGCSVRVVGEVWAEENAADAGAYPDVRIEYRSLTNTIPPFPDSIQPAQLNHTWQVTLAGGGAVGRVSLVNVNTKRIFGEYTMPTGLMRSFNVPANQAGQDTTSVYYDGFLDSCFLYDQAVALIAFLQMGEQDAARQLVDALLTVQNGDGSFPFSCGQATLYEHDSTFTRTGAVAWVCYALLLATSPPFVAWFPNWPGGAAQNCLGYILGFVNSIGTVDGGKGQYVDGVLDPAYVVPWWSVEHNIDTWWCLDLAHQLFGSGSVNYHGTANTMKNALLTTGYGWDGADGIFWQGGTASAGANAPDGMHALDTHTWGAILLQKWGRVADANVSLARAAAHYWVTDSATGWSGYTTFIPLDGYPTTTVKTPWYEGSFGAVLAERGASTVDAYNTMLELVPAQLADGSYLYALKADPTNDIHPWPCLIAPAWNVLAQSGDGTDNPRVLWPLT